MQAQSVERLRRRVSRHLDPFSLLKALHGLDRARVVNARRRTLQEASFDQGQLDLSHALARDQASRTQNETARRSPVRRGPTPPLGGALRPHRGRARARRRLPRAPRRRARALLLSERSSLKSLPDRDRRREQKEHPDASRNPNARPHHASPRGSSPRGRSGSAPNRDGRARRSSPHRRPTSAPRRSARRPPAGESPAD